MDRTEPPDQHPRRFVSRAREFARACWHTHQRRLADPLYALFAWLIAALFAGRINFVDLRRWLLELATRLGGAQPGNGRLPDGS